VSDLLIDAIPWILGLLVLAVAGSVLWRLYGPRTAAPSHSDYLHALELWIEGDLEEAATLLRKVVQDDAGAVEPFLYLGNLLRLQGDAERAAVVHRSLTVRHNLTLPQKIAVGLSLAEDLNALEQWSAAGEVLDSLARHATDRTRYWRVRFSQRNGENNLPEAARTLRSAPRHVPARDRDWFRRAYASYQLDRALQHALAGETAAANSRLKDVRDIAAADSRSALVAAVMAALANDTATAVNLAAEKLLHSPDELAIFLPLLEEVLLEAGQYARTIPILERACQADEAPASLWVDLAMLYEKLDQREKALQLLAGKAGRPRFTPNAAAPYLKMLLADVPTSDATRVWNMLARPAATDGWSCTGCGAAAAHVRWFCPVCGKFDSYEPGSPVRGEV